MKSQRGTSTKARKSKEDKAREAKRLDVNQKDWKRKTPYDFTGCLAHVDLTFRLHDLRILRVVGILKHNEACMKRKTRRLPAVPLHEHVWQVALQQLNDGAR